MSFSSSSHGPAAAGAPASSLSSSGVDLPAGALAPAAAAGAPPAPAAAIGSPAGALNLNASTASALPPPSALVVDIPLGDDQLHSDTSSATDSISHAELDANFNAASTSTLKQKLWDRSFVIAAQLAQLCYLTWRWYYFSITPSTLYVSLPFIISETFIVLGGSFITYFLVWNQCRRPKLRLLDLKLERKELPTVDIMIPCYNEPVEVRDQRVLPCLNGVVWGWACLWIGRSTDGIITNQSFNALP